MNKIRKNILFLVVTYFIFTILLTLPLLFIDKNKKFFSLFKFNLDFKSFFLIVIIFLITVIYEIKKRPNEKELNIFLLFFEEKQNIILVIILAVLSGFSEELFFRGYLYILLESFFNTMINNLFISNTITFFIISLLFALFHFTQGNDAFIFSMIFSFSFLYTVAESGSIIIPILAHSIFNFIEIVFILPKKIKLFSLHSFQQ